MNRKVIFLLSIMIVSFLAMPAFTAEKNGKVLVVYYSQTGSTRKVANIVAKRFKASLFELKPKVPYADEDLNWRNPNSRVCMEHDKGFDNVNVELENINVKDFDSYNVVFIGYPIWWGEASWVIDSFIKNNNFSDKKVFVFCTSISSGIGESMKRIETLAGTGQWIDGKRFSSNVDEKYVKAWLKTLKF